MGNEIKRLSVPDSPTIAERNRGASAGFNCSVDLSPMATLQRIQQRVGMQADEQVQRRAYEKFLRSHVRPPQP